MKLFKVTSVFLIVFISVCFHCTQIRANEVLIGRVNMCWPPLYCQKNGNWVGISIDAYRLLCREAGLTYNLEAIPWSRAMREIRARPIMIANLAITKERSQNIHFFGPHYVEKMGLALVSEYLKEQIENLDDLAAVCKKSGRQIAYQDSIFYSDEFNERLKKDKSFEQLFFKIYRTSKDNIYKMMQTGRLIGYLHLQDSLSYNIWKLGLQDKLGIHPFILSQTDVYIGVSKSISANTLKMLKDADKRLTANDGYKKLAEKWKTINYADTFEN